MSRRRFQCIEFHTLNQHSDERKSSGKDVFHGLFFAGLGIKSIRSHVTSHSRLGSFRILHYHRGKSLLELWVPNFLPDCQPPLIFVRVISNFLYLCSNSMTNGFLSYANDPERFTPVNFEVN